MKLENNKQNLLKGGLPGKGTTFLKRNVEIFTQV